MSAGRDLTIGGRRIGDDTPAYVVAEIGHNHQGDVEKARRLIAAAAAAGVDAVKLQKRENHSLLTRAAFDEPRIDENAFGATYGEHREHLELDADAFRALGRDAETLGVTFFATVFDVPSAELMHSLGAPAFKIASGDLRNLPLLEHVARYGRPLLISTGGASLADVERAYDRLVPINPSLALLQCTACYPTRPQDVHLRVIQTYRERFPDAVIGLSYHGADWETGLAAYALGARIHEQHLTLDRTWKGTDQAFSLEPDEMARLVEGLRRLHLALGSPTKAPLPVEGEAMCMMGKKLVAARALPSGHRLDAEDVAVKSPGDGLPPFELERILGRALRRSLAPDEALSWDALE